MNIKKTFFCNIDTQKDFMNIDGALYVPGAEDIKEILSKLTLFAKENSIKTINTADWHFDDSEELSNTPDFINTFPPHCVGNTHGVGYIDETNMKDDINITFKWDVDYSDKFMEEAISRLREIIITKDKFDLFSSKHTDKLINILRDEYTNVVVYGVAGDVCVKYAVDGLLERGFNVYLVEDATKALNIENYDTIKRNWIKNENFKIINSDDIIKIKEKL